MAVKIGLKFRKIPAEVAPIFWTPIFQKSIHKTVEIIPVYKIEKINEPFIFTSVKSERLKGMITRSPNIPEYRVDIIGDICLVAHLLQTE